MSDKLLFGRCLTTAAITKMSHLRIERFNELDHLIQILCRRNKNNPLIIGEQGIGKSILVESLAARIVNRNVPDKLKDVTLLKLEYIDLALPFRDANAELESSLRIIVVIDNIEQLLLANDGRDNSSLGGGLTFRPDSGGHNSSLTLSVVLVARILKGTLQCIGITNPTSYTKHLEKNPLWNSRFQSFQLREPNAEEVFKIVLVTSLIYSAYHGVTYTPKSLMKVISLSKKYLTAQFFPKKALDVLDEAGAKVSMDSFFSFSEQEVSALKFRTLSLVNCIKAKFRAVLRQDYAAALIQCRKELELIAQVLPTQIVKTSLTPQVTDEHIAIIISRRAGVPLTQLTQNDISKLYDLEDILRRGVIGQDEAVSAVTCAIRRARAGLKSPNKPIASFLFAGPTGVGKTELTKLLATEYFGTIDALLRFDMSEYMEKHAVSKLIGSPPGYIGFEEGGILTEGVRRRPYTIVLFDEIEKGHKAIFDLLLQVLDDGRLSDNTGRVTNFSNTLVILTSNLGANLTTIVNTPGDSLDYSVIRKKVMKEITIEFRPEFLNRLDEIVVFKPLRKPEITKIADILIKDLVERAKTQDIDLIVTNRLKEKVIEIGYDPLYGARPLKRALITIVEDPLTNAFLAGEVKPDTIIVADLNDDGTTRIFTLDNTG